MYKWTGIWSSIQRLLEYSGENNRSKDRVIGVGKRIRGAFKAEGRGWRTVLERGEGMGIDYRASLSHSCEEVCSMYWYNGLG